jgi:hypothetical protein
MLYIARLRLGLVVLGTLGCNDPAFLEGDACESGLAITVSAAAQPEFAWTPACAVGTLYVTTAEGSPMWQISSAPRPDLTPTNRIESGVTYGSTPAAAQEFLAPVALEPGQSYHIVLSVTDSHGERSQVGDTTFSAPSE